MAQRPVRTTPDQVLGKKKRIEPVTDSSKAAAPAKAKRPDPAPVPEAKSSRAAEKAAPQVETAGAIVAAGQPAPEKQAAEPVRSKKKRKKRKRKRQSAANPPAEATVHLVPRGREQALATWSLTNADERIKAGEVYVEVRDTERPDGPPTSRWRMERARGEQFVGLPRTGRNFVAQIQLGRGVAAVSTPVQPFGGEGSAGPVRFVTLRGTAVAVPPQHGRRSTEGELMGSAWGVSSASLGSAWGTSSAGLGSAWGVSPAELDSAWGAAVTRASSAELLGAFGPEPNSAAASSSAELLPRFASAGPSDTRAGRQGASSADLVRRAGESSVDARAPSSNEWARAARKSSRASPAESVRSSPEPTAPPLDLTHIDSLPVPGDVADAARPTWHRITRYIAERARRGGEPASVIPSAAGTSWVPPPSGRAPTSASVEAPEPELELPELRRQFSAADGKGEPRLFPHLGAPRPPEDWGTFREEVGPAADGQLLCRPRPSLPPVRDFTPARLLQRSSEPSSDPASPEVSVAPDEES